MIAAIQLFEYLHYHITPRIYVTLYNVNTWYKDIFWELENKLISPPKKMKQKETCFLQQIPACTIKGSLTEHFQNKFPQVNDNRELLLSHTHTYTHKLYCNSAAELWAGQWMWKQKDKPLLMIVRKIMWHYFFFKNEIFFFKRWGNISTPNA